MLDMLVSSLCRHVTTYTQNKRTMPFAFFPSTHSDPCKCLSNEPQWQQTQKGAEWVGGLVRQRHSGTKNIPYRTIKYQHSLIEYELPHFTAGPCRCPCHDLAGYLCMPMHSLVQKCYHPIRAKTVSPMGTSGRPPCEFPAVQPANCSFWPQFHSGCQSDVRCSKKSVKFSVWVCSSCDSKMPSSPRNIGEYVTRKWRLPHSHHDLSGPDPSSGQMSQDIKFCSL